ncbi:MAG: GAF domain-containing sensor histidine kinase [Anaerolineae bacterium]|nr:GAF domain-containing sensor histidine kinase [Anaerolineae bacterium]
MTQNQLTNQHIAAAHELAQFLKLIRDSTTVDEVFEHILGKAQQMLGVEYAAIYLLDNGNLQLETAVGHLDGLSSTDLPPEFKPLLTSLQYTRSVQYAYLTRPLTPAKTPSDTNPTKHVTTVHALSVPLVVDNDVMGRMLLIGSHRSLAEAMKMDLAAALGDQAAQTLRHAQWIARSKEDAVTAERDRISRDLHDAVSQNLFAASLIVQVLPKLWELDQTNAREQLAELRTLVKGALAEMRTILLEMRPSKIAEQSLHETLQSLINVIAAQGMSVRLILNGQTPLPPEVRVAFYRITQEALNNVTKHSHATKIRILLDRQPTYAQLAIGDNGQGFDVDSIGQRGIGLSTMRERATSIGSAINITSTRGKGTLIQVIWKTRREH